jgi:hypothetical protein
MRRRIIKISAKQPEETQANRPILIRPINNNQSRSINVNSRNRIIKSSSESSLNEITNFLERKSERVFIIGGGPSLINVDLSFIKDDDVICINKAIDLIKNPKYFITMDYSFFGKIQSSVKAVTTRAQSSHFIINKQHQYIQNIRGVYTDTRTNYRYEGLRHFTSIISAFKETNAISGFGQNLAEFCHGDNSGYCAIQFAILAGYTEIYLLGFDLSEPVNSEQTHFHSSYPKFSTSRFYQNINTYRKHLLGSITRIRRYNNTEFYTITPSSLEPTVPRAPLSNFIKNSTKDAVEHITKNPINNTGLDNLVIVAYYTINTPYEEEAKKLISSLNKLGLNHDVVGVTNLGNWQANTRFKAKFMEDMLNKHQEKNLLYIDSDAIVHSRPVLFEDYVTDIAVRWQDFRWRKNECLSGTIFMANNEKTRELCRRWQRINKNEGPNATTFEQWNLGSVIKEMEAEGKIKTDNLPPEYTMIFDSMRAMYPDVVPVIEHFQASRKLKNKV